MIHYRKYLFLLCAYQSTIITYMHIHTQSFHNLILSYAPKRIGYKHDAYVARVQLAFIDHNSHLNRQQLKTKDGKPVYTRKWGRHTSQWHVVPIPVPKTYSYVQWRIQGGFLGCHGTPPFLDR